MLNETSKSKYIKFDEWTNLKVEKDIEENVGINELNIRSERVKMNGR